eukprot:2179163-Pleurochrysis_carterae.AAC.2
MAALPTGSKLLRSLNGWPGTPCHAVGAGPPPPWNVKDGGIRSWPSPDESSLNDRCLLTTGSLIIVYQSRNLVSGIVSEICYMPLGSIHPILRLHAHITSSSACCISHTSSSRTTQCSLGQLPIPGQAERKEWRQPARRLATPSGMCPLQMARGPAVIKSYGRQRQFKHLRHNVPEDVWTPTRYSWALMSLVCCKAWHAKLIRAIIEMPGKERERD